MVWLNTQHINRPIPPHKEGETVFGGAMCTCGACTIEREQRKTMEDVIEEVLVNQVTNYEIINTDGEKETREFKSGSHVDITKLTQALRDAGFIHQDEIINGD